MGDLVVSYGAGALLLAVACWVLAWAVRILRGTKTPGDTHNRWTGGGMGEM